jgi:hypothetical protein
MRIHVVAAAAAFVVAGLAACSGSKQAEPTPYGTGDPKLAAMNPYGGPVDVFLTDGAAVQRALHTVAAHYHEPLRLTSISAHASGALIVDVQLQTNRGKVVRYIISQDGKTLGPIPVKLLIMGVPATLKDVAILAFDPNTIAFARLNAAARDAIARSKLKGGHVSQWGLGGAKKHVYVIVEATGGAHRILLLDHQLHFVKMAVTP